jgi:hypothetical protein
MKTKTMTTQSIRNSISRSPLPLAFLLIPLSLAIFTPRVYAERQTASTPIQVQLQVPGCNVNGFVTLSGTIILDTEVRSLFVKSHVNAQVRPDAKASTSTAVYRVEGTTVANKEMRFLNGLANVNFPGSFKVESGTVRFEIQYTAHLTFKQVGGRASLAVASLDNFQVVCL